MNSLIEIRSLKFHSNIHLSIETEFYFTKGFFRVAFHDTFHKIEIPGEIFHGIQMKLIILLPRLFISKIKKPKISFFLVVHPILFISMLI
jgi:hypothetical protein